VKRFALVALTGVVWLNTERLPTVNTIVQYPKTKARRVKQGPVQMMSIYVRGEQPILGPEDSRRMGELFDRGVLSESESAELQGLVATYSRLLHERRVREIAEKRGVSEEQVRRETEAAVAEALDWLHAFNADPRHRQELAERVKRRQVGKTGS